MAIRKRNKSWQIDFTDISGKRIRKSGFHTKAEAENAFVKLKANNNKGISNVINKDITLIDACQYFIHKYMELKDLKEKTKDEYTRIINRIIIPYLGKYKLYLLSQNDVENFILHLKKEKKLSSASISKYKTLLGSIIERQVEKGIIYNNVVKKVHCDKVESRQARALNKDEINILLNTCKRIKPNFFPMLFTALFTGMRRGELVALMWENVDLNNCIIKVKYSEYKGKLYTPKSKASYRNITICPMLKKVLLEQKLKTSKSKYVFPNSKGKMYIGDNVTKRLFNPVVKACNIGHLRFHDLRHTFGSQLIENNVSPKRVQTEMGHSSANVTLNIYTHVLDESAQKFKSVLDNLYAVS